MGDPVSKPTPWAPSQCQGMSCACHHPDAAECAASRSEANYGDRDRYEWCECSCHDRDHDEEDNDA